MITTSNPAVLMLDIEKFTSAQIRGMASLLTQKLHDETPVDTGYAASNWVASIGTLISETVGSKENVDNGRYASSLAGLQSGEMKPGTVIYISNSVPYIGRLNNGWSGQAPSGFIEAAVEDAQNSAEWPFAG